MGNDINKSPQGSQGVRFQESIELNDSSETIASHASRPSPLKSVRYFAPGRTDSNAASNSRPDRLVEENRSSHRPRQPKYLTPEDYTKAIKAHSRRSIGSCIYAGESYIDLAGWLQTSQTSYQDGYCLGVLYDFALQGPARVQHLQCNRLSALQGHPHSDKDSGQVLILRGYPPPEWINMIGGKYNIDPEFFYRHLDFLVTLISRKVFAIPSLPSTSANIHKLRITTILFREKLKTNGPKQDLEARRITEFECMHAYRRQFPGQAQQGDSIVREFATLDEEFVLVEQEISMCVVRNGEGWLALVLVDVGRDLAPCPSGPWSELRIPGGRSHEPFPIIQHHPKMVNRQTVMEKDMLANDGHPATHYKSGSTIPQSTASLPFELETFVDNKSYRDNPFYVLSNLFRHAAFSEIQVLNLIEFQIDREMGGMQPEEHRSHTLNNLQFFKSILTRHIRCIRNTLLSLKEMDETFCSRDKAKTSAMAKDLTADFERLLTNALELSARCTESMGVIMNRAIIFESRKAIEQSERVKKLTMLAAFFVPLSFTTSLFGMNFQEFGQGQLSVWLFAIVSIPMVAISFACYVWDIWAGFKYMLLWIWLNATGRGLWLSWRIPKSERSEPQF